VVAQGIRQGVRQDVSASGLPSSTVGHIDQLLQPARVFGPVLLPGPTLGCPVADDVTPWRAQSAVFLVHAESPRQAPGGETYNRIAGRLALRSGCYHSRSMNVL
jgi:hypothetical protein